MTFDLPQSLSRRQIQIAGHEITLQLPADPEQLLADAVECDDDTDPYWGILWDAAVGMATCVLRTSWLADQTALEIGCGAGLVGIAGLLAGLDVTFSDVVPHAVELAASNAAINGFPQASHHTIDWQAAPNTTYDVLLASDVLYDENQHVGILKFAKAVLKPGGRFWIGDPGRGQAESFLQIARSAGWTLRLYDSQLQSVDSTTLAKFQLLELS